MQRRVPRLPDLVLGAADELAVRGVGGVAVVYDYAAEGLEGTGRVERAVCGAHPVFTGGMGDGVGRGESGG
ncbi:hypothetical protein GLAREA_00898 [Glarea lozoyensis ATCC 20868]|uniref:Uncharacterized protein n=1 Tax=Glarea lozoyensis (strain ATCC 20868 / MF5171) TaxID=1116229 RepID=S3DTK8_GLAL2|nr:uncharacterized protein GLAREA_00898 [Glarea lozoyensis ATCC 20868]EPE29738.1 hypothetical protein GLAREA_00898 [Glarea lozoyensis ATCC 20868]